MTSPPATLADLVVRGMHRFDLWSQFIASRGVKTLAEIGVWRGDYAETMLSRCPDITRYYMLDPWRHLDDWNKPANVSDNSFEQYYTGVLERTEPWAGKRVVLRGRTTEVVEEIPDASLDFAYIDGDHSLRGISIDLIRMWPKIRDGGWIGGDDFSRTAWQHRDAFEPTLVFPFAVYFAEAAGAPIEALPRNQFIIHKSDAGFSFTDHMGRYPNTTVKAALDGRKKPAAKPAT
jgi:hypothetical protein